jgi:hypothetical protein
MLPGGEELALLGSIDEVIGDRNVSKISQAEEIACQVLVMGELCFIDVQYPASPAAPSRLHRWWVSLARFARKRIQTQSSPHKDCSSEIRLLAIG